MNDQYVSPWKLAAFILSVFAICAAVGFGLLMLTRMAHAEGWDTEDNDLASWFATEIVTRCCDQRDAYLADLVDGDGDNIVAIITDGSANAKYSKPEVANGTRIVVPRDRIKLEPPVPGGHAVIFLEKNTSKAT